MFDKLFGCTSETLEISSQKDDNILSNKKTSKTNLSNLMNGSYSNLNDQDLDQQVSIVQRLANSTGYLNKLGDKIGDKLGDKLNDKFNLDKISPKKKDKKKDKIKDKKENKKEAKKKSKKDKKTSQPPTFAINMTSNTMNSSKKIMIGDVSRRQNETFAK